MSLKNYFDASDLQVFVIAFVALTLLINWALISGFVIIRLCETGCDTFVKRWLRILLFPQLIIFSALVSGLAVVLYRKIKHRVR